MEKSEAGEGVPQLLGAQLDPVEVRVVGDTEGILVPLDASGLELSDDSMPQRPRTLSGIYRTRRNVAKLVVAHPVRALRQLMHRSLLVDGHDVVEMCDGPEVIDYLTMEVLTGHSAPDLIIAAFDLPGWDGFQLIGAIRGTAWDTPVALVVEGHEDVTWPTAQKRGAKCMLEWPFEASDLCNAVRRTLGLPQSIVTRYMGGTRHSA